jgi:enoyl-CoA hydratase/carnithine racemase
MVVMGQAIRVEDDGAVRRLVLCRPDEFNTITPQLSDELDAALDGADRARGRRGKLGRHAASRPTRAPRPGPPPARVVSASV